jgi:hypothetical protein
MNYKITSTEKLLKKLDEAHTSSNLISLELAACTNLDYRRRLQNRAMSNWEMKMNIQCELRSRGLKV